MKTTRREFMKVGAGTGAMLLLPWGRLAGAPAQAADALDSGKLTKYIDALPILQVMQPVGTLRGLPYYEVQMTQFHQRLHSKLPLTRVWGYNGTYPGATFETRRDKGIYVKWINNLPSYHLFGDVIDERVHGCKPGVPHVRSVVHLHGAHIQPDSDGFPEKWFTSNPNAPANGLGGPAGNFALYHYPNTQQAATLGTTTIRWASPD